MNQAEIAALMAQMLMLTVKLAAPPLLAALVVGLAVSVLQALTQISEATLSFVPKLLAIGAVMVLLGPFMLATLEQQTRQMFTLLARGP